MTEEVKQKKFPQYLGATVVTIGGFCLGTVIAWSSPAQPLLMEKLDKPAQDINWIFSIMPLGSAVSTIVTGFLFNIIGRKLCVLIMAAILCGGWVIISFSGKMMAMYCIGRFVTGFAAGSFCVTCPTYLSEIAHKDIRGQLGVMFQFQIVTGILIGYCLGVTKKLWVINTAFAICPVVLIVTFIFFPESPVYLYAKGNLEGAKKSLSFYRGKDYPLDAELAEMEEYTKKPEEKFWAVAKQKATVKGFVTLMLLHIIQQLSGINAIIFFAQSVFKSVTPDIPPEIASIMLGVVNFLATAVSIWMVDKFGRRLLWFLSLGIMVISLVLVGIHFYLVAKESSGTNVTGYIAFAFIYIYLSGFAVGAGPLPWLMLGELIPNSMKILCSVAACTNWVMAFVVTSVFDPLVGFIGAAAVFWIFGGVCVLGFIFVFFYVIETKGKTLDDIQKELAGNKE